MRRFTMSGDGVYRTNFQVRHRLSREEMITILCAAHKYSDIELLPDHMSVDAVVEEIKTELQMHGLEAGDYWTDDIDEDEVDRIVEWATDRVNYAFPKEE